MPPRSGPVRAGEGAAPGAGPARGAGLAAPGAGPGRPGRRAPAPRRFWPPEARYCLLWQPIQEDAGRTSVTAPVLAQLLPGASGSILGKLLLFFLKAGSLTFGSGLVIVPFLEQGLVQQFGWLDQRQFLIAVAIGMISPDRW